MLLRPESTSHQKTRPDVGPGNPIDRPSGVNATVSIGYLDGALNANKSSLVETFQTRAVPSSLLFSNSRLIAQIRETAIS